VIVHDEGPAAPQKPREGRQGGSQNAIWEPAAVRSTDIWSYDFMSSRTDDGRPLRILNVVDEYTRLALRCRVARRITAADVIAELEDLFARHGKPRLLRSDQRPRLAGQQVGQAFIERGSPQRTPTSSDSTARCAVARRLAHGWHTGCHFVEPRGATLSRPRGSPASRPDSVEKLVMP
jgi:hypothetical protein